MDQVMKNLLEAFGEEVYQATEEGLDEAEKILVNKLAAASPKDTGKFAKAWKGTGRKYKLVRLIGNTTQVQGEDKTKIALANILEYSTTRGRPFIKSTYNDSVDEIVAAIIASIQKGG